MKNKEISTKTKKISIVLSIRNMKKKKNWIINGDENKKLKNGTVMSLNN